MRKGTENVEISGQERNDDFFNEMKKAEDRLPGGAVQMPNFRAREDEQDGAKFVKYLEKIGATDYTYTVAQIKQLSDKFDVPSHYAQARLQQLGWNVI